MKKRYLILLIPGYTLVAMLIMSYIQLLCNNICLSEPANWWGIHSVLCLVSSFGCGIYLSNFHD